MTDKTSERASTPTGSRSMTIADLPNEILAHVFSVGTKIWENTRPHLLPFPLLVSAVNSHWRLLAHSTPELWTLIVPPLHEEKDVCFIHTSQWLQRSGSLPVSIVLDDGQHSEYPRGDAVHFIPGLLGLILKNAPERLRRLDISHKRYPFDDTAAMIEALRPIQYASHLQQFSFLWNQQNVETLISYQEGAERWDFLRNLPALRKLRWSGVDLPCVANLTTLNVRSLCLDFAEARRLFEDCSHLAHLVIDNVLPVVQELAIGDQSIQANSLQSIAIKCNRTPRSGLVYFTKWLEVPNLTYLELDGDISISSFFRPSLSSTKIHTLRVSNHTQNSFQRSTQQKEDLSILYSLSHLRHLYLLQAPTWGLLSGLNDAHRSSNQGTRTRTRSINFSQHRRMAHDPRDHRFLQRRDLISTTNISVAPTPSPSIPWPELRTISLDTLLAIDLGCICELVALTKSIQCVELSKVAMRHLSESLRRNGDVVFPIPWEASGNIVGGGGDEGTKDVRQWLAARVDLKFLAEDSHGLLDTGRTFLSELP